MTESSQLLILQLLGIFEASRGANPVSTFPPIAFQSSLAVEAVLLGVFGFLYTVYAMYSNPNPPETTSSSTTSSITPISNVPQNTSPSSTSLPGTTPSPTPPSTTLPIVPPPSIPNSSLIRPPIVAQLNRVCRYIVILIVINAILGIASLVSMYFAGILIGLGDIILAAAFALTLVLIATISIIWAFRFME